MRTASGRVTGHTGTRTAIRVPVVLVYFAPTLRKAVPVPDHRAPRDDDNPWNFAIRMLIWAGALALLVTAVFLFRSVMREPIGAGHAVPTVVPGPAVVYPVP